MRLAHGFEQEDGFDPVIVVPKSIDNSQVVRQVDPRYSRELWLLAFLVAALVVGLVLYALPHVWHRETGQAAAGMAREREVLIEQNRKLRLEKAYLEDLRRIEAIAVRQLKLEAPPAGNVVIVEKPEPPPDGTLLASGESGGARN